jgi:hypothetical protein
MFLPDREYNCLNTGHIRIITVFLTHPHSYDLMLGYI